jgi:DNA-binding transcriptional MerR regulator
MVTFDSYDFCRIYFMHCLNLKSSQMISAKEISNKHNITYQTVNHYTDFALLPVITKKGNVRFYNSNLVDKRFKKIKSLIAQGYSLRLIRKKLVGV